MSKDIRVLKANTKGRDIIIADLHGNIGCLVSLIKKFEPGEMVRIISAGDAVDRGEDSVAVIETILKSGLDFHMVRGNHEEMTIASIKALELIVTELQKENKEVSEASILEKIKQMSSNPVVKGLIKHLAKVNGGEWVLKLFAKEYNEGLIQFSGDKLIYSPDSKIDMVNKFMQDLPYIISVEGTKDIAPYNVVHADMPISDLELKRKIETGKDLSPKQRRYATSARAADYDLSIGRTLFSAITYCGHEIIGLKRGDSVRRATSMVDLDRAAYLSNILLALDHKARTVIPVASDPTKVHMAAIQGAAATATEIKQYLNEKFYMHQLRAVLKTKMEELATVGVENFTSVIHEKIEEINSEIQQLSEFARLPEWGFGEFIAYACADDAIPDHVVRVVIHNILEERIAFAKDKNLREDEANLAVLHLTTIADAYNKLRPTGELIRTDQFRERLQKPSVSFATKAGLFAPDVQVGEIAGSQFISQIQPSSQA